MAARYATINIYVGMALSKDAWRGGGGGGGGAGAQRTVALYPGPSHKAGKGAWYTLLAHAQRIPFFSP